MKKLIFLLPLLVFGVVISFAIKGLTLDQSVQPSNLLEKPIPNFELTDLPGHGSAFTPMDLRDQVTLMNVFGSWCAACQVEHPVLLEIATAGEVPIYGLNWADTPERGAEWLRRYENPYARVGNDEGGRVILDFGVTGAPETFVVDKKGVIRFRHAGPVTQDLWEKSLRPLVRQLQAE